VEKSDREERDKCPGAGILSKEIYVIYWRDYNILIGSAEIKIFRWNKFELQAWNQLRDKL
jgi:hypothetical protein